MMMYGKDRDGNTFPPPLSKELCEDIAVRGGRLGDTNKECVKESNIRAVGSLNSTTVTINPSNHYESTADEASIVVPAPKLMCLVYTMADAHANRIRAMRDTWAGGCDGFLAFSTESDPRLPAISLEHEGPEAYTNVSTIPYYHSIIYLYMKRIFSPSQLSDLSLSSSSFITSLYFFIDVAKSEIYMEVCGYQLLG